MFLFVGLLVLSEIKIHLISIQTFFLLFSFLCLAIDSKKSLFVQTCWQRLSYRKCHLLCKKPVFCSINQTIKEEQGLYWSSPNQAQRILLWLPPRSDDPGRLD